MAVAIIEDAPSKNKGVSVQAVAVLDHLKLVRLWKHFCGCSIRAHWTLVLGVEQRFFVSPTLF